MCRPCLMIAPRSRPLWIAPPREARVVYPQDSEHRQEYCSIKIASLSNWRWLPWWTPDDHRKAWLWSGRLRQAPVGSAGLFVSSSPLPSFLTFFYPFRKSSLRLSSALPRRSDLPTIPRLRSLQASSTPHAGWPPASSMIPHSSCCHRTSHELVRRRSPHVDSI